MNTFRLTQNQIGKNLYLLPVGNGCNIGLTPFPNTGEANYEDVDDPYYNSDDDVTYVHSNVTNVLHDLYSVANHTIETGVINYVQVIARAKSNLMAAHKDSTFKLLLDDSNCTNTQKSDSLDLVTTYSSYSHVWNTNPYTGVVFNWANIDNYQCGVECSSALFPSVELTLTIRPNEPGIFTECTPIGDAPNWKCVDEAASDEDATYNYTDVPGNERDFFKFQDHTTEAGTINKITLYARYRKTGAAISTSFKWRLYTNGSLHDAGFGTYPPNAYTTFSRDLAVNPITGNPWTWGEVDNIQAGYTINNDTTELRVTQYYIVVTYTVAGVNADIRATQCCMKVNYSETVYCDLNQPEEISQDYAQNIVKINHWSGNRSVYGLSKNKDTTVITGYEIEDSDCTDACARLKSVEELGKQGNPVSLTGLGYSDYNDEYQILSWGWKCISKKPAYYEWLLELERTT